MFRWHPAARLFAADGREQGPDQPFAATLEDRPATAALAACLAGRGRGFRIGGHGPCDVMPGQFETLTGGSLAAPRRILRSQASWCASFTVNAGVFGLGPGCRVAVLGRLSHSLALYGALEGMCLGAEVHMLDGLRPDRQRAALAARAIQVIYATPAQLRLLVQAAGPSCPALRLVLVGGAKLDAALRDGMAAMAAQADVREFYGAAETSFITLTGAADPPDSVGQPYPGVDLSIRDSSGQPLGLGAEGEVWMRSPYLFQDYAGDDRGSARWADGWLCVGEIGVLTAGGLYLKGRAGRMVTIADRNVFPEQIEAFLATLPGVRQVAVVPRADAARGVVLVAVMQGDAAQTDAIMAAARTSLGPLIAPRALIWRLDWPVLPSGKTDLAAILDEMPPWP